MARKKNKQTRKYKPKNEFRTNNSPLAKGHPNYVFGETPTKYKSLGLTTSPREDIKHFLLSENPNPKDKRPSYIQKNVLTTRKDMLSERLDGWKFAKDDMSIIRQLKKKYKKRSKRSKAKKAIKKDKSW